MKAKRATTIATFAVAITSGLAGAAVHTQTAVAQEANVHAAAVGTAEAPTLDAKSALLSAIALGYTDIRSAGPVGDLYQVEAVDTTGSTVRLIMDPDTGAVTRIEKDR